GGVVGRFFIEHLGGDAKIGRLVTIGSPLAGTKIANFGLLMPSAKETRVRSHFYEELGPLRPRDGVTYTSVWARADPLLEPPESASVVPVGEDRVFDDIGHLSLLVSRRVLDCVAERLAA